MLQLTGFRKSYDSRDVLRIDSLQLAPGCYWLQGPNGAGKSTLLRCIAGLTPYEGNITVDGLDLRKERIAYCRNVSWADAEPQYPGFLNGNDLLAFYLKTRGGTSREADSLLDALGARSYQQQPLGGWSSGMLKKLSLVLALLGSPRWVLLDEPLITLDTAAQVALTGLLSTRIAAGTSFLLTSHQPLPGLHSTVLQLRDQNLVVL
ncbi:MAG: ABC transporter ATP-binding protein [Chitinophagaceae bacterium]|nr:MAG: ABC transporter ATP-binding protein [Chitinophagaceae bacterium]